MIGGEITRGFGRLNRWVGLFEDSSVNGWLKVVKWVGG